MERPSEEQRHETAPACVNPESTLVGEFREPEIRFMPSTDTQNRDPARRYNAEELEFLYCSMPMTSVFYETRAQIANVMAGLRKGTAGNKEIRMIIDIAYDHWEAHTREQDRKFRAFIDSEKATRRKKSN